MRLLQYRMEDLETAKKELNSKLIISRKDGSAKQYEKFLKLRRKLKIQQLPKSLDLEKLASEEQLYQLKLNKVSASIQQCEQQIDNVGEKLSSNQILIEVKRNQLDQQSDKYQILVKQFNIL